ncbi:hypothetical protein [Actinomadura rudentiformis]|uniref:Mce-associated membrane protein n=1 Tax=Actinomadura rudentiformis TaxID=359158 RepID=A0A6H9YKI5_9ACTN|nr:hypothetical protein [Actinomadura rudentiformis]KAB2346108.1 hypothetical protein F8566_25770 [Actinomadura rudentiformis]
MTAKTSKDVTEETDGTGADETVADEVEETEEPTPKPAAKRKRRVRVIEVLEDEDLDEVLESLENEDEDEDEDEEPAPRKKPVAKKAATAKQATPAKRATAAKKAKPPVEIIEAEDEEDEEEPEPGPARRTSAAASSAQPTLLGLPRNAAIVVVVLVALLASAAIWQWRSASGAAGEKDERAAVVARASAFGDLATSYNATNYQSQMDKIQKLMAGDLLERYKSSTAQTLPQAFKTSPQAALTSKTKQVYVGNIDGKFATVVVAVDIAVSDGKSQNSAPQSLIRLSLVKEGDEWKVSQMNASGDDGSGAGSLPGVPSGQQTQQPKSEQSEKPKN